MQAIIREAIQLYGFRRLLLAVSGGLDSICLVHYFVTNKDALGIEWLGIAHVNHGLREGSADLDEALVCDFANAHGVPFFCAHLDGAALKASEGSLEEAARDGRYKALFEIASQNCASTIVTAHHAGDQAETVYMRLRRGTTLEGLRGMQSAAENADGRDSVKIYRPFLDVPRADLLEYARENNLVWREDESNSDTKFTRNKIRHELLPALENDNPGANAQLTRIAGLAAATYDKVLVAADTLFSPAIFEPAISEHAPANAAAAPAGIPEKRIALNKKVFRKILVSHANADLSEMFRLWLSAKGFRFPIDFFKAQREPASTRIPSPVAYRRRSIAKIGHTVWICEFDSAEAASKFVSCD